MRTNRPHYSYSRNRQPKKTYRQLLLAGFVAVLLLFFGYNLISPNKDTSMPSTETASFQLTLSKDAQLAWPAVGQAAIGSVETGLLARSPGNEEPRPTASMAKVITALAIMEKRPFELGQSGQTYTLTSDDAANYRAEIARGGSIVPVHAGMTLTQYQAMQAMLIASSNNMADTLVEKIFGSVEAYTSYAQAMVKRMGLDQTVIADASGFSPATISTPSELVAIGITALKNPVIADIVTQSQAELPEIGLIKNTNELLGADGVIGIKTGTTDAAGSCLLFAARSETKDGQEVTIVGVIMGDTNATHLFNDSRMLLTSAKQGFDLIESQPADNTINSPPEQQDRAPR